MRTAITAVLIAVAAASISGWSFHGTGEVARGFSTSGCASVAAHDSANTLEIFRNVVSGPSQALRTRADLPNLPVDSVRFAGTSMQCDSVLARYVALRASQTGTTWPSTLSLILLRVGPTRWVGDPHVGTERSREWIILDSTFNIVKVWNTRY